MKRKRKVYTEDFKIKMVKEYIKENLSIGDFATKNNISHCTFARWLGVYRKNVTANDEIEIIENVKPIDVTKKAKEIINETNFDESKISVEINGITLTFPLKNLKKVLEAIQNGWSY